jgi:hypothetical protein
MLLPGWYPLFGWKKDNTSETSDAGHCSPLIRRLSLTLSSLRMLVLLWRRFLAWGPGSGWSLLWSSLRRLPSALLAGAERIAWVPWGRLVGTLPRLGMPLAGPAGMPPSPGT